MPESRSNKGAAGKRAGTRGRFEAPGGRETQEMDVTRARGAAADQDVTAGPAGPAGPVITAVSFRDEDEDETTRLTIVQTGFGGMADWSALLASWRGGATALLTLALRHGALLVRAIAPPARAPALNVLPVMVR